MHRGRSIYLAALAGSLALMAGGMRPAQAATAPAPITTPAAPVTMPSDKQVLVSFGGVLNAVGYNIYCHTAGAAPVLINPQPITVTFFVDNGGGAGLTNGTPLFYSVKALIPDASGKPAESPASPETVTTPNPPLLGSLVAYNIGTQNPGSATMDPTSKVITVRASGGDITDSKDSQTFIGTPVDGDFTITAKIPSPPTIEKGAMSNNGKIGVEMRQGLSLGDPYAFVFASVNRSPEVLFEGRRVSFGDGMNSDNFPDDFSAGATSTPNFADIKFPVWVRLSQSSTVLTAQQSEDGTTWTNVGNAEDFTHVYGTAYVGIGATSATEGTYLDGQIDGASLTITSP